MLMLMHDLFGDFRRVPWVLPVQTELLATHAHHLSQTDNNLMEKSWEECPRAPVQTELVATRASLVTSHAI